MHEVIYFNYGNRLLSDCMDEINRFLEKTSFEVVSVSHAYNRAGSLEVLVCLRDNVDADIKDTSEIFGG